MSLRTFLRGIAQEIELGIPSPSISNDSDSTSRKGEARSDNPMEESVDGPYRAARELIEDFIPMFRKLNEEGVNYCVVGGMAVLLQTIDKAFGSNRFRATHDADIMFDDEYTNSDFARAYMSTFGEDGAFGRAAYDEMFGEGAFEELCAEDQALVNCSFCGPETFTGRNDYPDFDVVRKLNGFNLSDLDHETIEIDGVSIPVATVEVLLRMKRGDC